MSADDTVAACLSVLPTPVANKIAGKLRSVTGDEAQHTFHELLVGAYLARQPFEVDYERKIVGRTPDWTVVPSGGAPACIVDVATYNLPARESQKIEAARGSGLPAVVWPEDANKMWAAVDQKASAYDALATQLQIPFVVAIFGSFYGAFEFGEIRAAVHGTATTTGVFAGRPAVSGVLFARELRCQFWFDYEPNPTATHAWHLKPERWPALVLTE
jgi:hypothetical protein